MIVPQVTAAYCFPLIGLTRKVFLVKAHQFWPPVDVVLGPPGLRDTLTPGRILSHDGVVESQVSKVGSDRSEVPTVAEPAVERPKE